MRKALIPALAVIAVSLPFAVHYSNHKADKKEALFGTPQYMEDHAYCLKVEQVGQLPHVVCGISKENCEHDRDMQVAENIKAECRK